MLQEAGEWLLLPGYWYHAVLNVGVTAGLVLQGNQPRESDMAVWGRAMREHASASDRRTGDWPRREL